MAENHDIRASSIGDLSRQTGIAVETIRYYERIGLVGAPDRTAGGHRVYDETALRRLVFVKRSRGLGFGLDDIRALLDLAASGKRTCGDVRTLTQTHLDTVRRKRVELQRRERRLVGLLERCTDPAAPECAIIDALIAVEGPRP